MSKDFVTVDYFSHSWDGSDLGCASQELKRQISEVRRKLITAEHDLEAQHDSLHQWGLGSPKTASRALSTLSKEKHRLLSDEYRLARLNNISWRQHKASLPNAPKIDPITINWQKNSDVIWLYGPLFRRNENDTDFENRLGCGGIANNQQQQAQQADQTSPSLKPALCRRNLTKEEYVHKLLGEKVLKKYKRRSFPMVDRTVDLAALDDGSSSSSSSSNNPKKKELRFKPDVLEYIYHADVPLLNNNLRRDPSTRGRPDPRKAASNNGSSRGASSAAQRAKALLLAARSSSSSSSPPEKTTTSRSPVSSTPASPPPTRPSSPPRHKRSPIMPPSPPLSPSDEGYIKFHSNDTRSSAPVNSIHVRSPATLTQKEQEQQQGSGWLWSFYSASPPIQQQQEEQSAVESIPSLCANLFSLSAEMLTLMGTVAVYKGVSYGLGCPASQQQARAAAVAAAVNRSNLCSK
ncbi:hypothetical protein BDB00DRAFT_874883 [Zychaea mexicana]|uniref:uncharacterized protein n=1 Tax=Zychaea mexicana TaxID=64656 RepID=UPI0022FE8805|nr:uncharacterized protein BDB00DRAFT_874883 [Zychaea mexicana]KAI9490881.1 hypothetical protein BDB00DRAFT_874883 [Zychaea mexicana]